MSALDGKRIVVTRPVRQAGELIVRLAELGAVPVAFPTVEIKPAEDTRELDTAISHLEDYDWVIFTSRNGVDACWERLSALGKDARAFRSTQVAAIGPVTERALNERGVRTTFMPEEYVAEAVAAGIGDVAGKRILLPRADIARQALREELERRGAQVTEIPAYHTVAAQPGPEAWAELERGVDVVTFTSSSTARHFFDLVGQPAWLDQAVLACIGPITAKTVRDHGRNAHVIAAEYTTEGLVKALLAYFQCDS